MTQIIRLPNSTGFLELAAPVGGVWEWAVSANPGNTYCITQDCRVLSIGAASTIYAIVADNRTMTIDNDNRVCGITQDNRIMECS